MNKYLAGAILIGIVGFTGCASTAETESYQKRHQAAKDADQETLVGTRLAKPTTERVVKAVGNNEYNRDNQHRGIANEVGMKGN